MSYFWSLSPMEQYEIYPLLSINFTFNNVIFYLLMAALVTIFISSSRSNDSLVANWWGI
jgi:hypothetical protein